MNKKQIIIASIVVGVLAIAVFVIGFKLGRGSDKDDKASGGTTQRIEGNVTDNPGGNTEIIGRIKRKENGYEQNEDGCFSSSRRAAGASGGGASFHAAFRQRAAGRS